MAVTTFQEGLNPLFGYNFHRCFGNNHEIVQACVGVCAGCVGGVGSGSGGLGGPEDVTFNEGFGWFKCNEE